MSSAVKTHYDSLLADHYTWMFGDTEAAIARNEDWFREHGFHSQPAGRAVDLGCGSGFQTIALARLGFSVDALDFCEPLIRELRMRAPGLPVVAQAYDITKLKRLGLENLDVAVCMGDTLVHLESKEAVAQLFRDVADTLKSGGKFVVGFRDLTQELTGNARFIPVRSGADVIFTCVLEYEAETVHVHDLVYEREGETWTMRISDYRKLRLAPDWVEAQLQAAGFSIDATETDKGFVHIIATRQ